MLISIIMPNIVVTKDRSDSSRAKSEEQALASALESYYIDHNQYPLPDYDENGRPVIPHILTTPFAYITSLFHDPFKDKGKGYYGYGCDMPTNSIDTVYGYNTSYRGYGNNTVYSNSTVGGSCGWIVVSYGPDRVDGNSKMKIYCFL